MSAEDDNALCICGHRWRWHQSGSGPMVCFGHTQSIMGTTTVRGPCPCEGYEENGMLQMLNEIELDKKLKRKRPARH